MQLLSGERNTELHKADLVLEVKLLLESYIMLIRSRTGLVSDRLPPNEEIKEKVLRMNQKYLGDSLIEKKVLLAVAGWSRRRKSSAGNSSVKHRQIDFGEPRTHRDKSSSRASLAPFDHSSHPQSLRMRFDEMIQPSQSAKAKRRLDFSSRIEEKVIGELQKKLSRVRSGQQHKGLVTELQEKPTPKSPQNGIKEIIDNFGSSGDILNFTDLNSLGQSASLRLDDSKQPLESNHELPQAATPEDFTPSRDPQMKKPSQFFKIHNRLQPN